jgi:hypothetical protein
MLLSIIKDSYNSIYKNLSNLISFETEEEKFKNLFNSFFKEYDDILDENKLIFNIHLYKTNNDVEDYTLDVGLSNYSRVLYKNDKNKSVYYLYKYRYGNKNNKSIEDNYIIDIYFPYGISDNYIIKKKYYYKISSTKNDIKKDIQVYNDEPTLRFIITEIIDFILIN